MLVDITNFYAKTFSQVVFPPEIIQAYVMGYPFNTESSVVHAYIESQFSTVTEGDKYIC